MVEEWAIGHASTFHEMFVMGWVIGSVRNLHTCVRYLEWCATNSSFLHKILISELNLLCTLLIWSCIFHRLLSMQDFAPDPVLPLLSSQPEHVEKALNERYSDAMKILEPQGKELELLIAILPDNNGPLYGMHPLHLSYRHDRETKFHLCVWECELWIGIKRTLEYISLSFCSISHCHVHSTLIHNCWK